MKLGVVYSYKTMMDMKVVYSVLALLFVLSSVNATICDEDTDCLITEICNEQNSTSQGLPQCSVPAATTINSCETVSCSSNSDCSGKGIGICNRGLCVMSAIIGDPCLQDADCGASRYCVYGSCNTEKATTCSSDSTCNDGCMLQVNLGWCTNKRSLGMSCDSDADCQTGVCDSSGWICTECRQSWGIDGAGHIPSDTYCDIFHYENCTNSNLYKKRSQILGFDVPIITDKKQDGDSCDADSCCVSGDCEGGVCVKSLGTPPTISTDFCLNYSTRDLTTEWFDGMLDYDDPPNTTFFEEMFNHTNLTVLIPFKSAYGCVNITHQAYYREANATHRKMLVWFYDPIDEEICYFRQEDTQILWKCLEQNLTVGADSNSTHSYYNVSFLVEDSEAAITSTGDYRLADVGACSTGYGATLSFMRVISSGDAYADTMAFACGATAVSCVTFDNFAYYSTVYGQDHKGASGNRYNGGVVGTGTTYLVIKGNSKDKERTAIDSHIVADNSFDRWGWTRNLLPDSGTPSTGWSYNFIATEMAPEDYSCCESSSDCPNDFCCGDSGTCYYCGAGLTTSLSLTPEKSTLAEEETITITATLREGTVNLPSEQITFTATAGAISTSCTTNSLGQCTITYTAPPAEGNVNITASFARDGTYAPASAGLMLIVENESRVLRVIVVDSVTASPIGGALVRDFNSILNPAQKYTLPFLGMVEWGGLDVTPASYTVEISKEGYIAVYANVYVSDTTYANLVELVKSTATSSGSLTEPLPDMTLTGDIPANVGEVTSGFNELVRYMFARYFIWILFIILFLIAIGVVRGVIEYVSS